MLRPAYRSPRHGADQRGIHPRRHPVPPAAARGGPERPPLKPLSLPIVLTALIWVAAAIGFLVWRAAIDFGRKHTARGILQTICAFIGCLFVGVTYWTQHLPVLRGSAWTLRDMLVRAGAIRTGVLLLVGT